MTNKPTILTYLLLSRPFKEGNEQSRGDRYAVNKVEPAGGVSSAGLLHSHVILTPFFHVIHQAITLPYFLYLVTVFLVCYPSLLPHRHER